MKVLSDYINNSILFKQPSKLKRVFHLTAGDEIIGTIVYPKFFSCRAEVEILGEKLEFRKMGIWGCKTGIYNYGFELPYAELKTKISGLGFIELPKGERIEVNHRMWKGMTEVFSSSGSLLLTSTAKLSWTEKIRFTIPHKNKVLDENPWLIMLIAYSELNRKAGAGAAAAALIIAVT